MVDNRYVARGDKTKRYLSDPEVVRLHERRRSGQADAAAMLDVEFGRDPIPVDLRRQAHLFLAAEPLSGRPAMLLHLTDGDGWHQRLLTYTTSRGFASEVQRALAGIGGFSPDLDVMSSFDRRPGGAALTTYNLAPGRLLRQEGLDPESAGELEVYEDGGLRMFTSRLSDHLASDQDPDGQVLFEAALVVYTRRLIALAAGAAEEVGYFGNWALAAGATGLAGCRSFTLSQSGRSSNVERYSGDIYRRAAVASYAELTRHPGQLTDRLTGQLLRSFGARQRFAAALADPGTEI
jgi:hypothetical protein